MSQANVERIIGLLAMDQALRRRFVGDPRGTLHSLVEQGLELTPWEFQALATIDSRRLARFAGRLQAFLQKTRRVPPEDRPREGVANAPKF